MPRELQPHEAIERSIIKKFRRELWNPFIAAVKRYELISEGDKIAVCISGGKDSMLMAKLMQQLQRISSFPFELVFLVMDPGYNPDNRRKIEENAKLLAIPITIFETDIYNIAAKVDGSPCYLCARMRRGHLYAKAKELGCNKIALGHHMSDVVETTLMGMMYGSQLQGMLPRIKSTNFEGMELIRPLYCIHENAVLAWRNYNNLSFIRCACRFTEVCNDECCSIDESALPADLDSIANPSKRLEMKNLLRYLRTINPDVDRNIFTAIHNVSVDTMPGYKLHGVEHSFLEKFSPRNFDDRSGDNADMGGDAGEY